MSRNNNTEMQTDFLGLIVHSESQLPIIVAPKGCVVAMGRRLARRQLPAKPAASGFGCRVILRAEVQLG